MDPDSGVLVLVRIRVSEMVGSEFRKDPDPIFLDGLFWIRVFFNRRLDPDRVNSTRIRNPDLYNRHLKFSIYLREVSIKSNVSYELNF